ncbi:hypothetical protein [Stutzerimonas stutzeri]|uniref:hypothetical protein n=1 Tax=Stutzerimonas stutzeri TaxID=316 RepID=UPI00210AA877|nr:hypothetical protein [Stutzerimonas stutzeri]MCQ4322180.1 hypothetical protein [Stutzerimonas stutzeri]
MDKADRADFVVFTLAFAFIAFVGGALVTLSQSFPYRYLNDAYKAAHAALPQLTETDLYTESHLRRQARRLERGVTIHDAPGAFEGLTLYTSGAGSYANLMDMQGKVVHRWALPYHKIWKQSPASRKPRPEDRILLGQGPSPAQRRPVGGDHCR